MRLIFLILIFLFQLSVLVSQNSEKDYSEAIKIVEVWLEAQKDFEQLPGISASIIQDQEVLWSKGFGLANIEEDVPTSEATLGSICSISK